MDTVPWYIAGPLIGLVVPAVYLYGGRKWGVSSTFRDMCAATFPAGREYFKYDWRSVGSWRLVMVLGVLIGGFLGVTILPNPDPEIGIAASTRADLAALGIQDFQGLVPAELFSWDALLSVPGFILIVVGGFFVGFGTRYADGCTSGHAISGLAAMRKESLVAVIGFFIGGIAATHFLLPLVLGG